MRMCRVCCDDALVGEVKFISFADSVVGEDGKFRGMMAHCSYQGRNCYQYIDNNWLTNLGYSVELIEGAKNAKVAKILRNGNRVSMSVLSYTVLCNPERGNKILREFDYDRNSMDILDTKYQSNKEMWWICEACGRRYTAILNNRIGHKQSDCNCTIPFCKSSSGEETFALLLKNQPVVTEFRQQVDIFGDRRRADMAFEMGGKRFILEYDGDMHNYERDIARDREAKALGYTTIRILEHDPYRGGDIDRLSVMDGWHWNEESNTYTIPCLLYNGDNIYGLQKAFDELIRIMHTEENIELHKMKVTSKLINTAKNNVIKVGKKISYISD